MTYLCNEDIKSVFTRAGRCSGIPYGSRVFNSDSFLKAFRVPHLPEDSREGASILSKVKILKYDCSLFRENVQLLKLKRWQKVPMLKLNLHFIVFHHLYDCFFMRIER